MSAKPIKFFYVRKNDTNTMAFPVDKIRSFILTDATSLLISIEPKQAEYKEDENSDDVANVDLEITTGTSKDVIRAIVEAGRTSRALFIPIADDDAQEYVHSGIQSVTSTTE